MNHHATSTGRNLRTFVASLLSYVLLTSQLAPMALAFNGSGVRNPPTEIKKTATARSQEVTINDRDSRYAPVPVPLTVSSALLAPSITATKTDTYPSAPGGALPGEIITYSITINNGGPDPATNVTLTDTVDVNTAIVNTPKSTPIAFNDTYAVLGNVRIQVPDGAQDLLANDRDPDTDTNAGMTITTLAGDASAPFAGTSTNGGQVTATTGDGSFQYNPAPGFTGSDTFSYTATDADGGPSSATVTLTISSLIWFVNAAAPAGGDGRITNPFNCLVGVGCFDPTAADEAGDNIFLYTGTYPDTGALTLLNNQQLFGQGASGTLEGIAGIVLPPHSDALPALNGDPSTVTVTSTAAGIIITAGNFNTLRGFTFGNNGSGAKIQSTSFNTLTVREMVLNGTGQALNLDSGALDAIFASIASTTSAGQGINLDQVSGSLTVNTSTTITDPATQGILVTASTANLSFGNTSVSDATDGISLQNNASGTRTFGTLSVTNGSGVGFLHSVGGGATTVTGATTITNPVGIGISIQSSTTAVSFAGTTVSKNNAGVGVDLGNNSGNTTFNSLSITTSNGTGLLGVGNTGQINVTTNAGSIASTSGPAINITKAAAPATPIALNFDSLTSTNSGTQGVNLDRVSGSMTVAGAGTDTDVQNSTGIGIQIQNTSAGGTMNFGDTIVNGSGNTGVFLNANAGGVTFADLDITPDAGIRAFHATSNTGTTTSTSGTIGPMTDAQAVDATSSALNMVLTSVTTDNTGDADPCVNLSGATGTLNMQGGTLTGGNGTAFNVSGGSVNSTYSGNVSQANAQRIVNVDGTTGGTIAFNTGTVTNTASSTGVNINNANGGVSFANLTHGTSVARLNAQAVTITGGTGTYSLGAVSIFTNNVPGIVSTNADGTLNSASGTVDAGNNTAVNIDGPAGLTTLGMTLTRVDSDDAAGSAPGIIIQDTNGSFVINGDGANTAVGGNGSGGVISGKSGADGATNGNGVFLNNASGVTLRRMTINGTNQNHGIRGTSVSSFTLEFSTVSGTNGTSAALDEGSVNFDNLTGTAAITSCVIEGGFEDNLNVTNTSGTLNRLVITGSTFGFNSTANGNNNILIESLNVGTVLNYTLQSSLIKGSRSDWLNNAASSGATMDSIIGGSTPALGNIFDNTGANAHPNPIANGNRLLLNATGTHTFNVSNNKLNGSLGVAMNYLSSLAAGVMTGRIEDNDIGCTSGTTAGICTAGAANSGSTGASGIGIQANGGGDMTVLIDGNDVRQYNNHGILFTIGDQMGNAATVNVTVSNNTANTPGTLLTDFNGFHINSGQVATDNLTSCFNIFDNNFTGGGKGVTPPNNSDVRLRQRQATTIQLPGYTGPARDNGDLDVAEVITYLRPAGSGGLKNNTFVTGNANSVSTGGGYVNSPGGAACTQPSAPVTFDETPAPGGESQTPGGDVSTPGAPAAQAAANNDSITARRFISSPRTLASQARGSAAGQTTVVRPAAVEPAAAKNVSRTPPPKPVDDPPGATPPVVTPGGCNPTPGGGGPACTTLTWNVGTLPAGRSVTITFQVQVENPYSGPPQVSNQGTITFGGGGGPVLTDDPSVGGANDPTVTPIAAPIDVFVRNARVAEPTSGTTSMLFTVALASPATQATTINYDTANGTAVEPGDYVKPAPGSSIVFQVGEQLKVIPITVNSDVDGAEVDENFTLTISGNPTVVNIVTPTATGTITVANPPGTVLISELRTSGPGGSADEFVEIYNNTDSPHTVAATDASAGYGVFKRGSDCNATPVLVGTIPNGTIIPARGHFLLVGSAYSLTAYAAGNLTMSSDIENDRNVSIYSTANILQLSTTTRFDAVGFGTNTGTLCDLQREGTNLGAAGGSTTQHSFFRIVCNQSSPTCPTAGNPKDTNDNAADFMFADTQGTFISGLQQRLGAPGPENLAGPIRRDATIGVALLDSSVTGPTPPNRVRDLTSDPGNNSTFGTMSIRRRFVNNTGASVTRLRFRIIDITTFPSPGGGVADLRVRTSSLVVVMNVNDAATCTASGAGPPPCTVNVQATTLEQPPTQPNGGGFNSSAAAGTVTLGTPLANGASINLNFLLGVQATGSFKFFFIIEALP